MSDFKIQEFININIRKIETKDMEICCKLLNQYHNKFKISILFSLEEFIHQFTFRENIIETYVVENNGQITDMLSFYFIPSKLNNKYKYTDITKAYIYYYFYTETDLVKLIENGIYLMKKKKMDMVNVMKQYDNDKFIDKLKFKEGNGELNFYFYNWKCPQIEQNDMAIVMV
jgi:glycylpeptide N-tetradecanoyltransferase